MSGKGHVLVTGGSGYIAGFCIRQLLSEGWQVRTTIRNLAREEETRRTLGGQALDRNNLKFMAADLNSDSGWAEAVKGADYVLHVASPIPNVDPKTDDELVVPAREGTLRVLRAARDAGVKRVVVTSSTAAVCYGQGSREKPYTENEWSDPTKLWDSSAYERSKTYAERAAWDFMQKEAGSLQMTAINPGAVVGPVLGSDFSVSIEIVRKLMDGSVPGCPHLGWALVDARDIADLHIRAMTHPDAAGQRFLGAGEFLWMGDIARVLRERIPQYARRIPSRNIPDFVVRVIALFDRTLATRMFELSKIRRVDASKAARILGWKPRSAADSVTDCAKSLIDYKLVPAA
jgi:dihydroflavonol-4-reductase